MQDLPTEVAKAAPGFVGALIAALWSKEAPARSAALVMAGTATAYYAGDWLSRILGVPGTLAGFFVGLYGIAVVNKGFEALQTFPLGQLLSDWAKSKLPSKD